MAPKLLMRVRIAEIRDEARAVRSFVLVPTRRDELPAWRGGAHVIAQLPDGARRSYSLCGDPRDRSSYRIAVLHHRHGRGGSDYLYRKARVGDEIYVTYPQDGFALDPNADHHLLIAGGIGVTPLLGMLYDAPAGVRTEVHYCMRSRADAAFVDQVTELADQVVFYDAEKGCRLVVEELLNDDPAGRHVYCCGPERLMTAVAEATASWPAGRVHFEAFEGMDREAARQGAAFHVDLAVSGRRLEVPDDRSLLEVLHQAGVTVECSCEAGICGSCMVQVLDGDVIHRDLCLSDAARREWMTACVSRGAGLIKLNL
jgi:vanillate O-demethylase ferredoxin subunit